MSKSKTYKNFKPGDIVEIEGTDGIYIVITTQGADFSGRAYGHKRGSVVVRPLMIHYGSLYEDPSIVKK